MTRIWTEAGFLGEDPWLEESDEVRAGEGQKPLLSLERFLARAEDSIAVDLGVVIAPGDDVRVLAPYLDRLALVAVRFPAFNDGRGFSHASLLRERLGYEGDLRAVGDVLIDQVPLMLRTGFTSFAVTNATALARLEAGRLPGIAEHYQPTARPAAAGEAYSWRRRRAADG